MSNLPSVTATPEHDHLNSFHDKIQIIHDRVSSVAEGYHTAVYIVGRAGTSKTYSVEEHLKSLEKPWVRRNARISPLGLFDLFGDYPEHTIVLDDIPSLFSDRQALQILLPALDGKPHHPRTITYKTRTHDERVQFVGGVIAVSNLELRNDPLANALASRVITVEHEPTDDEIWAFMQHLASRGFKELTPNECTEVAEFVRKETQDMDRRLDLRYLTKAWNDRRQWRDGKAKTHWTKLVQTSLRKPIIEVPEITAKKEEIQRQIEDVRIAMERFPDDTDRQMDETGLKKSTFYERRKAARQMAKSCPKRQLTEREH